MSTKPVQQREKKTVSVHEALKNKYQAPHYVLMFEVRDATGFDSSRSADAIAISLYRTRGREIIGFEIKHSRSDWLKELSDPSKAEEIGKFCDYFYLVTPDESVAYVNELPIAMGWMIVKGERVKIVKKPEKIHCAPLDRQMLCSLLYSLRAQCFQEINKNIESAVEQRVKTHHSGQSFKLENLTRQLAGLQKKVSDFEEASGVNISSGWIQPEKVGHAVNFVLSNTDICKKFKDDIEFSLKRVDSIRNELAAQLQRLEAERPQ